MTKDESVAADILPSLISKMSVDSPKETRRYLSVLSAIAFLSVITLFGFCGMGLVVISSTVKPWVSYRIVPLFPLPQER